MRIHLVVGFMVVLTIVTLSLATIGVHRHVSIVAISTGIFFFLVTFTLYNIYIKRISRPRLTKPEEVQFKSDLKLLIPMNKK